MVFHDLVLKVITIRVSSALIPLRCSTALIPAANTRFQREAGIREDTARRFADDIRASNGRQSDRHLTLNVANLSAQVVEWLADYVRYALTELIHTLLFLRILKSFSPLPLYVLFFTFPYVFSLENHKS